MRKLFVFLVCACFTSNAFAGQKTTWKANVVQNIFNKAVEVATADYTASILSDGTIYESTTSFFPFTPFDPSNASPTEALLAAKIHGRFMLSLLKIVSSDSAQIRIEVWDSSGLDPKSPYYKSYFGATQTLHPGETTSLDFTQGDASVQDGFVNDVINLKLVGIATCKDDGDCKE